MTSAFATGSPHSKSMHFHSRMINSGYGFVILICGSRGAVPSICLRDEHWSSGCAKGNRLLCSTSFLLWWICDSCIKITVSHRTLTSVLHCSVTMHQALSLTSFSTKWLTLRFDAVQSSRRLPRFQKYINCYVPPFVLFMEPE
jgi:hypothetical protein